MIENNSWLLFVICELWMLWMLEGIIIYHYDLNSFWKHLLFVMFFLILLPGCDCQESFCWPKIRLAISLPPCSFDGLNNKGYTRYNTLVVRLFSWRRCSIHSELLNLLSCFGFALEFHDKSLPNAKLLHWERSFI